MNRSLTSSLLLAAALAAPPPATHVVAVSGEVTLATAPDSDYVVFSPAATAAAPGEFVVAWSSSYTIYSGSQETGFGGGVIGRKIGLHAQPLAPEFPIVPIHDAWNAQGVSLAANASGRFAVTWELTDSNFTGDRSQFFVRLREFGADTRPLGPEVNLYTSAVGNLGKGLAAAGNQSVAIDPTGRYIAAWEQPLPLANNVGNLHAQLFAPGGEGLTGRFAVTGRTRAESFAATAMDGRGNSIVVYQSSKVDPGGVAGLYLRRYDPRGRPLGGEVRVAPPAGQTTPKVAASAGGSFVVVWSEGTKGVRAQRFDAAAHPSGPALVVSGGGQPRADVPAVAMDSRGSFAVAWAGADESFTRPTVFGRIFDSAGIPQGGEIEVPIRPVGSEIPSGEAPPGVALAENGTFLVTWHTQDETGLPQISVRAFRALSTRDRCVYRGRTFLCGPPGGELTPVIELGNGVAAGDRPFLADFDGDGADDPCIRRVSAYLCALSGSGYAVKTIPFGAATHVPLLGDVDGDGRAEPCVRRGRFFLCDTAHDSGGAEIKVPFGLASDLPLLGDVDGDGKADLCVFRAGQFFCDTNRDGTRDLIQAESVQPGDAPLLGDADGDGRADFCVVRDTTLLCDLERNGMLTPQPMAIQPGDVVLLGKVDRL